MTDSQTPDERTCACHARNAYDCWVSRYGADVDEEPSARSIEDEGGPCQCSCHDHPEEDCDPAEYL